MLGLGFLVLLAAGQTAVTEVEHPVKNVRPSVIVSRCRLSFPSSITLEGDDLHSLVRLRGSSKDIEDCEWVLDEFDVKPMPVQVRVQIDSFLDKFSSVQTVVIPNMDEWDDSFKSLGFQFSLRPRVNDDRTVTVTLTIRRQEQTVRVIARLKDGETKIFRVSELLAEARYLKQETLSASPLAGLPSQPLIGDSRLSGPEISVACNPITSYKK